MAQPRTDRRRPAKSEGERLRGIHSVREALRARRRPLRLLRLERKRRGPECDELRALAAAAAVPVEEVAGDGLVRERDGDAAAQGVELLAGPLPELGLEELLALGESPRCLVALDGVEDPQNVGAIARVAEAAGVTGMILTRRRSPPLSPALARASAGAIEWLPVARVPNLPRALNTLKSNGFWSFGCDADGDRSAFDLPPHLLEGDRVVVLGAEGRGLRRGVDRSIDHRVRIPMGGRVDSLNVASAAAVVLFEFRRRSPLATRP